MLALLDAARRFYGLGVWYPTFADDININAFFFFLIFNLDLSLLLNIDPAESWK